MRLKISFSLFLLWFTNSIFAQFPALGKDSSLDIATWNLEWFGDTENGPTNETTQQSNVRNLIMQTDFDVFAVQEVSNEQAFASMNTLLDFKYGNMLAPTAPTQKTALYWKKDMFDLIASESKLILTDQPSNFVERFPLQVALKTKGNTKTDTLYFIVIHLKAFSDQSSYFTRSNASKSLKVYLESMLANKKYILLGDYNDDLDQSTYNSQPSPYKNFLDAGYTFPTRELTLAGKNSYAFGSEMIDHILQSKSLDSFYYTGSAKVFSNAASFVSNFSNNTSDHFPVYAAYNWKKLTTRIIPTGIESQNLPLLKAYPNPVVESLHIQGWQNQMQWRLISVQGQEISQGDSAIISFTNLPQGIYQLHIQSAFGTQVIRILHQN